jgi:hypothetical protein
MNQRSELVLTLILCLFLAASLYGQSPRSEARNPVRDSSLFTRPVGPESSATRSAVADGQAVVPRLMKFSGVLHDASGKPLAGTVDVTFSLYSTEAGGDALWFETQSVQADELGRYTALLGAMHTDGLPVDMFTSGEARWLGIQVGSEAEQQPRVLLVSVPYALKAGDAETLGGKPASAYMLSEAQSASTSAGGTASATAPTAAGASEKNPTKSRIASTTALTACASLTSDGTAVANSIARFTTACNIESSALFQSGSNIGVGTSSPIAALDVYGNNAGLRLRGTGTHQLSINGATSGRLGQDVAGFFFASDTNGGAVRFLTNNGALHEWMRVTSAGNVGIGTTTPGATLDVAGMGRFTGGLTALTVADNVNGSYVHMGTLDFSSRPDAVYAQGAGGTNARGVTGIGGMGSFGELGTEVSGGATGVYGHGGISGVYGDGGTYGVYANSSNNGHGVHAESGYIGVYGHGNSYGIYGDGVSSIGVYGKCAGSGGCAGVYGTSDIGFGVEGVGTSTADAGYFYNQSGGYAGYFVGDVDIDGGLAVAGKITAGTKDFRIDHPLDPTGKYLYHASVESSEMINIYSGNVVTDDQGKGVVQLPTWFQALNEDFRYQLTVVGQFAQPIVSQEIQNNRFVIMTDKPNVKVSWQVTGVRHDAYAKAHPLQVEVPKLADEKGTYLHPQEFGQPETKGLEWIKSRRRIQSLNPPLPDPKGGPIGAGQQ